jgi:hypothetical protein
MQKVEATSQLMTPAQKETDFKKHMSEFIVDQTQMKKQLRINFLNLKGIVTG